MNADGRSEQSKKDANELYRGIGEFVVEFEHVCSNVQGFIIVLLQHAGLRDQAISHILLAGITADPLRTLLESLIRETRTLKDVEEKILTDGVKRFQELTQARNDIVHGTWFIGYGNKETIDFSKASGVKLHKNKSGAAVKRLNSTAKEFGVLTKEAAALRNIFFGLQACLFHGLIVENIFAISNAGHVQLLPGH